MAASPPQAPEEHAPQSDLDALLPLMQMRNLVGYLYGSEDISLLFYALIRREKPQCLVELGSGIGVTAFWMAQAAKENGAGRVWTIDDGSQWADDAHFRAAMAPLRQVPPFSALNFDTLTYGEFMPAAIDLLGLGDHLVFLHDRIDADQPASLTPARYPFLTGVCDFLFLDISRMPDHVLDVLYAFLPTMAPAASVFIDSASTSVTSFLFLETLVEQLNRGKVPRRFLRADDPARQRQLTDIIASRRFRLMHLVERLQRAQNSTAWLRIEPNDYVPHPETFMKWV